MHYVVGLRECIGIATCNSLDGAGIESWWGWELPQPSRQPCGPPSPIRKDYPVIPGDKAAGAWR